MIVPAHSRLRLCCPSWPLPLRSVQTSSETRLSTSLLNYSILTHPNASCSLPVLFAMGNHKYQSQKQIDEGSNSLVDEGSVEDCSSHCHSVMAEHNREHSLCPVYVDFEGRTLNEHLLETLLPSGPEGCLKLRGILHFADRVVGV